MTKEELKEMLDEFKSGLPKGMSAEDVKSAIDEKLKTIKDELDKSIEINEIKKVVDEVKKELLEVKNAKPTIGTSHKTLEEIIEAEIKALGVNNVAELKAYLAKNGTKTIEIKAIAAVASTDNSDTIGRTNLDNRVSWAPIVANAFLQNFRTVAEASNKSKFGYVEGSYTGAAAYVGEGTGNPNSDSASASATTMDYAKIQSVLSVNTEVYEDIPDFAAGLAAQMRLSIEKFVDDQALSGDGLAPAGVQHIKGLLAYATTFVPADFAQTVYKPNEANVASAVATKIAVAGAGKYTANVVFIHPMDLFKLKNAKDNEGQPVILTDTFGNPSLGGLRVVPTVKITEDTMLVMDSNVAEWRTKRGMQLKMGQILADDAINDKQSAILMARYQLLVRSADTAGIMKVTSIAAAKQTMNTVQA